MTHQAIADLLGVSRVSVTRMLAEAKRAGIVTITIRDVRRPFAELEERLAEHFGLREVHICDTRGEGDWSAFSRDAGEYLGERLANRRRIAIGVSSTLAAAVAGIPAWPHSDVVTIPIGGGWAGQARFLNPDTSAAVAARALGGQAYSINAPLLADSEQLAASLLESSGVASVLDAARSAEVAVFGIGLAPVEPQWEGAFLASALTSDEVAELRARDVAGDMSGRCFDSDGNPIRGALDRRVVCLTLDEVKAIPERIAVVIGAHKSAAVQAAMRGGLLTALVTDVDTATVLDPDKPE